MNDEGCAKDRREPATVEPDGGAGAPNNRSTPGSAPTGEALTDEQIDAILLKQIGYDGDLQAVNRDDLHRVVRAALSAYPSAPVAPAWRHVANEWADMATSAWQWLRNVKDGSSTVDEALQNCAEMYEHCMKVSHAASATPSAEAQPTPNEPARYRLLQRTDLIEPADEFLAEDGETWAVDPGGLFVGTSYAPAVLRPARRPLRATPKEN